MLTADLVKPLLQQKGTELSIRLLDSRNPHWQQTAGDLIELFQQFVGQTVADWQRAVERYEGDRIDYIVVRGLARVISGEAIVTPWETVVPPAQLRACLFTNGPSFSHASLFQPKTRQEIMQEVAGQFETTVETLEETLFADRTENYIIRETGQQWTPERLLARYNLELARGVLYWASHIIIEVASSYKDLWRYIKYFKLMFWAEPNDQGGYRIWLDGPISPFVSSTIRYGRQLAVFLPALLLCEHWQLEAAVHPPQGGHSLIYRLDASSALPSHFKRSGEFDSHLEADFAQEFEQKIGSTRGHWQLKRETDLLLLGDTVMIPDFTFIDDQDDERKILVELVGFWHPDYLRRKVEKVRKAHCSHLLLLVYQGLNITEESFGDVASEVIFFQQKPVMKDVIATINAMADRLYGPRIPSRRKKRT